MSSRKPTGMNVPAFTGAIQPTASTRILERRWLPRCCNLSAAQAGDVEGDRRPNPLSGARHDQARRMPEANGGSEIAVDSETFDNALPVLGPVVRVVGLARARFDCISIGSRWHGKAKRPENFRLFATPTIQLSERWHNLSLTLGSVGDLDSLPPLLFFSFRRAVTVLVYGSYNCWWVKVLRVRYTRFRPMEEKGGTTLTVRRSRLRPSRSKGSPRGPSCARSNIRGRPTEFGVEMEAEGMQDCKSRSCTRMRRPTCSAAKSWALQYSTVHRDSHEHKGSHSHSRNGATATTNTPNRNRKRDGC